MSALVFGEIISIRDDLMSYLSFMAVPNSSSAIVMQFASDKELDKGLIKPTSTLLRKLFSWRQLIKWLICFL